MEAPYFVNELVIISDGFNFEYANVESVKDYNVQSLRKKANSVVQNNNLINHVVITPITLSDIGLSYIDDAMLDKYNGPCFHGVLRNNDYNVKVILTEDSYLLAKESAPGALEKFVKVETIGDIQYKISTWQNKPMIVDANRIGDSGPRLLHENTWLNQAILQFISNEQQKKNAALESLTRYLKSCIYNIDTCRFWLSECYIDKYIDTNDKSYLELSKRLLIQSIAGGYCDHYKEKLAWIEEKLSS